MATISNRLAIPFSDPTSNWRAVTYYGAWDAQYVSETNKGNFLFGDQLSVAVGAPTVGAEVSFGVGALNLTFDRGELTERVVREALNSYIGTRTIYISLHYDNPGDTGANELGRDDMNVVVDGGYTRSSLPGGVIATARAVLTATSVASIIITGGSGYTSVPTVTISGGGGSGATVIITAANANDGGTVALTNVGSGYTSVPTVTISGGGGSGATARAVLTGTSVASFMLINGGIGYSSAPSVIVDSPPSGTQATATVTLSNTMVVGIARGVGGSGYTSVPNVSLVNTSFGWQPV